MDSIKIFWPFYLLYVILTGIDSFIVDVPNVLYLPVLFLCIVAFTASLILEFLHWLKTRR